jgi:hypothetical protein
MCVHTRKVSYLLLCVEHERFRQVLTWLLRILSSNHGRKGQVGLALTDSIPVFTGRLHSVCVETRARL